MRGRLITLCLVALCVLAGSAQAKRPSSALDDLGSYEELEGFFTIYWDEAAGRTLLAIQNFDTPFIYQSSLARGVGSNDLGLDRSQLGATRLVEWRRSGPKVFLVELNLQYRADSDDPQEKQAVRESFAESIIWGCKSLGEKDGATYIDLTSLALSDAHNIAGSLRRQNEGIYAIDSSRSAIYLPRTKSFPDNTEIEATVTYTGRPSGRILRTVVPDAEAITIHIHHSFIRLPEPGYKPLSFDPRAGVIGSAYGSNGYTNFAAEVGGNLTVNYGRRHRLEKVDPTAPIGPAVEPIVYYVDSGVPEPVRSALVEGASWWDQAFTAAGYEDAFRVEILPAGIDPMDVRYNVIQWVHRQTRGWSYGSPIYDPRTGEIIKAVITLGSLRVRQDRVIFEGLLDAERTGSGAADDPVVLALARLRQLAAHEVGHGLGFPHNMAASTDDRASVMDYPAPRVTLDDTGAIDVSDAYAVGLGAWDIANARYLYTDFSDTTDEATQLNAIVRTVEAGDLTFVTDAHARPLGAAHPSGSLWDNGAEPIAALENALLVRAAALSDFGLTNVPDGAPVADLRAVITPIYLWHRYQIAAAAKLIGGYRFSYAVKGDGREGVTPVPAANQHEALAILLSAVDPDVLALPGGVAALLEPHHLSWFDSPSREEFQGFSGPIFDESAAAGVAARMVFDAILEPARASRLAAATGDDALTLAIVLDTASWAVQANLGASDTPNTPNTQRRAIARTVADSYVDAVLALAESDAIAPATAAQVDRHLAFLADQFADHLEGDRRIQRHLNRPAAPAGSAAPAAPTPPGSPIGTLSGHSAMAHRETCWHCGSGQP